MSRRHTSTPSRNRLSRVAGTALVLLIALTAILPAVATAQNSKIRDSDVEWGWQLLTYRDADGDIEPVPAGVGATLSLFSNSAFGEAACSNYESSYTRQRQSLFIDPPEITRFDCDPISQAFDEVFYQNLAETQSISVSDSILTLYDIIGDPLMTLTRARVDDDPTVARWDLARIADADGSIEPVIQGLDPWVEFLRGGRLVGSTGCGSFLGSYTTNDGTMAITDVAYRLDACTEGAHQQAQTILATLDTITDFEVLPAGLSLNDGAGITRLALTPDIDLGRRIWTPIAVYGDDGEVAWDADFLSTSAVRFNNNAVEGRSICRSFHGDSLRSGLALSVPGIKMDGAKCPKSGSKKDSLPLAGIEKGFITALKAVSSHALRGAELELKDVDGNTLMRLLPQAELVGPTWVVDWMDLTPASAKKTRRRPIEDTVLTATFEDIEVVLGDTGAEDRTGANFFTANYRTPKASRISITDATVTGRACWGSKKKKAECKQQGHFLRILRTADGYIVRDGDLRLLKGPKAIIAFSPEVIDTGEN